jgi:hypothetical protein
VRRAYLTDSLVYRWERLREDQRQRALDLVAQEQRRRQRQRHDVLLIVLLIVLVLAVGAALPYVALHGVTL